MVRSRDGMPVKKKRNGKQRVICSLYGLLTRTFALSLGHSHSRLPRSTMIDFAENGVVLKKPLVHSFAPQRSARSLVRSATLRSAHSLAR